jgi:transposase
VWLDREAELERKIGQMTLENDFLKKALQRLEEQRLLDNVGGGARSTKRSKKK